MIKKWLLFLLILALPPGNALAIWYDIPDYSDFATLMQLDRSNFTATQKAAEGGDLRAQTELGLMYLHGLSVSKDAIKGMSWLQKAADNRYAPAQHMLGHEYLTGNGAPQNHIKYEEWTGSAAEQGYAPAQYSLGMAYELGVIVRRDEQKGCRLLRTAADQGHSKAFEYYHRNCAQ